MKKEFKRSPSLFSKSELRRSKKPPKPVEDKVKAAQTQRKGLISIINDKEALDLTFKHLVGSKETLKVQDKRKIINVLRKLYKRKKLAIEFQSRFADASVVDQKRYMKSVAIGGWIRLLM